MALPITVPFTFGNATTTQSLSSLDADFSTVYNAVNGIGNGTVSLANVSITGGTVSANITSSSISSGTSNVSITSANGAVSINTNGTNAVYINASQNVGIGTSSPSQKLQVNGVVYSAGSYGFAVGDGSSFTPSGLNSIPNYGVGYTTTGAITSYTGFGGINFYTAQIERMQIDQNGNLLVGRTTNSSGNNARIAVSFVQNGQVFTPTTNDKYPIFFENAAGTTVGYIFTSSSATTYATSSDYRLKNNVQPMITGLATVSALKPVTYDWKIDGSFGEGFIAHELQEHIPVAVIGEKDAVNEDGTIKSQGVDYSKIVVHLVAAIQELSAKNDALEARLVALESK